MHVTPATSKPHVPRIIRLEEHVVNRIAAGEVVQRPVSALKEMLENSLDAGATQISVTVKEGGNKLLQIQDNGSGIEKDDLPLLCERHATSKLQQFEDLESINTLGFRGEALASISFVAHLTVTTMTKGAPHGYKVTYRDGEMSPAGPKPCAAVQGTSLLVEDLFYNMSTRKQALKSSSEELSRIVDIMGRYAAYKAGVAFSCKRQGEARADLHTLAGASRLDNIRAVYGPSVARSLLPVQVTMGSGADMPSLEQAEQPCFTAQGYASNADYSGKKTSLILFINGRPVDCGPLKKALEATYASILPKASRPWVFLDLNMPGNHVDVNLHPTKKEVGFLHQDELVESIRAAVENMLLASNDKRTYTQTLLPQAPAFQDVPPSQTFDSNSQVSKPVAENKLVRTDSRAQTLHTFLQQSQASPDPGQPHGSTPPTQAASQNLTAANAGSAAASAVAAGLLAGGAVRRRGANRGLIRSHTDAFGTEDADGPSQGTQTKMVRQLSNPETSSELSSIRELLQDVTQDTHEGLLEIVRKHTYVGMADETHALLQHGTRLYLLDVAEMSRDMFYQQALRRFEHMSSINIRGAAKIEDLAVLAVELEEEAGAWREMDGSKDQVAPLIQQLLMDKTELLKECFGVQVTTDGRLAALPQLIESYCPDLNRLPYFVLQLARDVDWEDEKACFRGLAQALAELYHVQPPMLPEDAAPSPTASTDSSHRPKSSMLSTPTGQPADAVLQAEPSAAGASDSFISRQQLGIDTPMPDSAVPDDEAVGTTVTDAGLQETPMASAAAAIETQSLPGSQLGVKGPTGHTKPLCSQEWNVQHVIFPAMRMFLKPSRQRAVDGSVIELTRLEKLYRVFERC